VRPIVGYNGTLRIDLAPDENQMVIDVANLKSSGATRFDPDATTTVRFEKVSIDYFLKQMLTGALGVSYMAPDDLGGGNEGLCQGRTGGNGGEGHAAQGHGRYRAL